MWRIRSSPVRQAPQQGVYAMTSSPSCMQLRGIVNSILALLIFLDLQTMSTNFAFPHYLMLYCQ